MGETAQAEGLNSALQNMAAVIHLYASDASVYSCSITSPWFFFLCVCVFLLMWDGDVFVVLVYSYMD